MRIYALRFHGKTATQLGSRSSCQNCSLMVVSSHKSTDNLLDYSHKHSLSGFCRKNSAEYTYNYEIPLDRKELLW